jgi:N-acetylglucosamine-6-phosphate deacetylase
MTRNVAAAAEYAATDPHVLGLHLEGPFLSELRRGVHDPAALRAPEPAALEQLLTAGAGQVRVLTLAPELPGGPAAVRFCVASGVHPAIGHSDAGYATAAAAFEAGADLVTHAFNGMRPMHHRDPAIIGAAMDAGVVLEAINDGFHLHPATVRLLRAIAPGRMALVTDAMAAACAADGDYTLAGFAVRVSGGQARLVTDDPDIPGSIAGSTLTLDVAVRRAVQDVGMSIPQAVAAASLVPARYLQQDDDFGSIAPGKVADLVITDSDWAVQAVLVAGRWADERRP